VPCSAVDPDLRYGTVQRVLERVEPAEIRGDRHSCNLDAAQRVVVVVRVPAEVGVSRRTLLALPVRLLRMHEQLRSTYAVRALVVGQAPDASLNQAAGVVVTVEGDAVAAEWDPVVRLTCIRAAAGACAVPRRHALVAAVASDLSVDKRAVAVVLEGRAA